MSKLIKNKCEIAVCEETLNLHEHHIIERTEINTTNNSLNLAILCPGCHSKIHSGHIKIIGIYPSTQLPNHRTLIYEMNGKKNMDIDTPYIDFKNKSFKIFGANNE